MKKNLIKIALFGVFAFLFSAGFVSCKDYDDDIDALRKDVESLKTQLKELSGFVEDVTYDAASGKLIVTKNGSEKEIDLSKDLVTYTLTSSNNADGTTTLILKGSDNSETKVNLTAGNAAVFNPTDLTIKDGVIYYGDTATGAVMPKQDYVTLLKDEETGIVYGALLKDGDATGYFYINDALPLTSVVFEPQAYLMGIQAMKALSLEYNPWYEFEKAPGLDNSTEYDPATNQLLIRTDGEIWKVGTTTTTISPNIVAYYHLNPASVTIDQIKNVTIISSDREYVTRNAASAPRVVENGYSVEDGMLRVEIYADTEFIKSIDNGNPFGENIPDEPVSSIEYTTLAIQVEVDHKDAQTKITSDYAAVYRSILQDFTLALKDKEELGHGGANQRHVYGADATTVEDANQKRYTRANNAGEVLGHAQVAIELEYDYTLAYDGEINLSDYVTTHYKERLDYERRDIVSDEREDINHSSKLKLSDYGLGYRFVSSNYTEGVNETPQAEFVDVAENGKVTARTYGESGSSAIGREPLVRVELVDKTNNNAVVNAGWIKLLITRTTKGIKEEFPFGQFVARCGVHEMTTETEWMNLKVYNPLELSKTEFHNVYEMETNADGVTAKLQNVGDVGTIVEINDPTNTQTVLHTWSISQAVIDAALEAAAAEGKNQADLEATIVYKGASRQDVIIRFTATVYVPTATVASKISDFWTKDPEQSGMFVNAVTPGSMSNLREFITELDYSWVGNLPKFTLVDQYPNSKYNAASYPYGYKENETIPNNMGYRYQFQEGYEADEEANGVTYKVYVDNSYVGKPSNPRNATYPTGPYQSYSYLLAKSGSVTQLVAVIDTYTGIVEYNNGDGTISRYGELGGAIDGGFDYVNKAPYYDEAKAENYQGVEIVNYPNNHFGTELLNRDAAAGDNMFGAGIELVYFNPCRDIKVTNGKFTAWFYRPVNATKLRDETFNHNANSDDPDSFISYAKLLRFTDWRFSGSTASSGYWSGEKSFLTEEITGIASTNNGQNWRDKGSYWAFYDIQSVHTNVAEITTTLNGGKLGVDKLTAVSPKGIRIEEESAFTINAFNNVDLGGLRYYNNGQPLGDGSPGATYDLRLPIVVTYRWGQFTVEIDVTVHN